MTDYRTNPVATNDANWYPIGTISLDELYVVSYKSGTQQHQWVSSSGGGGSATAAAIKDPVTGATLVPDGSGAVTLPNQDEVLLGAGAPTGAPPAGKEVYFDTVAGKYYMASGATWSAGFGGSIAPADVAPLVATVLLGGGHNLVDTFAAPIGTILP